MAYGEHQRIKMEGLTYDDVLLVPARSSVMPREANTSSRLTRNIEVNVPVISAAMDTVTEADMAIALAREGGVGVLHKNMTIDQQVEEVESVKRAENGMIQDPITISPYDTVASARRKMNQYSIGGIPVVNESDKLVGIVTNRDVRFESDGDTLIREMMTAENLVTVPVGTTLNEAIEILQEHKVEKLPVVDDDGHLKGLITFKDIRKRREHPNACKDEHGRLRVGAAVGVTSNAENRISRLVEAGVDFVVVDTAHGHSEAVLDTISDVSSRFGDQIDIIGGNVATADGTRDLIAAGVDCVKVGVGPGSICTTRVVAGTGVPQLTAVMECSDAARGHQVPVIADGGIRQAGDMAKALAAGANTVMIGSLFAGLEESPGETIIYEGRKYKSYRGMGSTGAMGAGSKDRYFQDAEDNVEKLVPEGVEGRVPYSGTLDEVLHQMVGGLRAAMGYCGCETVEQLHGAEFVRTTDAGIRESHPHDVEITKESPSYFSQD